MGLSFIPMGLAAVVNPSGTSLPDGPASCAAAVAPILVSTALLTLATMVTYPFEMATIAALAQPPCSRPVRGRAGRSRP